jgi:ribosome-associated toxin RatA of RatAB toxin-antitoxin module
MKNSWKTLLSITFLVLLTSFSSDDLSKWKLEKNKHNIRVYSYVPEGESIKQIKVYSTVKATVSSALSVIRDVPHYINWIYSCDEATVLKRLSTNEMIYYSISDAPWPIENRDLVMYNKIYQDKKTKTLYSVSFPVLNKIPIKKGLVRVTKIEGQWKFTPKKNGILFIEYSIKIDPGGNLPSWVINLFIEKGPYQTILNFKEELKLKKHKNAVFEDIEN